MNPRPALVAALHGLDFKQPFGLPTASVLTVSVKIVTPRLELVMPPLATRTVL